jgi:hypothetical protein
LEVGKVNAMAIRDPHGFQRGVDISGCPQIVAMQVQGMRQVQFITKAGQSGNDLSRCDPPITGNHLVQSLAVLAPLPPCYTPRVDRFHPIGLGGMDVPG